MNIVVKLKGNSKYEPMLNKHVIECLKCSFSCPFSVLENLLLKGLPIVDKYGNEYKLESETPTPRTASRGGSNPTKNNKTKNLTHDSQITMEV